MTNPATTYQPLGNFIQIVDHRNRDLQVTKLLGLSIEKCFIPSIANTIGTDMSTYKIIQPRQFAYGPVTSRNGDKITIALYTGDEPAIISQAYVVFEITGTYDIVETQNFASLQQKREQLLPEYLMMWFRRPEFDRYARYHSHGSAREIFDWDEMCATQIPVPPIAEQRAIVAEYAAVQCRMEVNKRLIAKLEETAQTLYKKMFVDGVDKENLPDGWRMGTLGEIADFCYGKLPNKDFDGTIPVFSGYGVVGYTNDEMFNKQHIIVIARGDSGSGKIVLSPEKFFLTNLAIAIILNDEFFKFYLYYHLLSLDTSVLRSGSAQAQVTVSSLFPFEIIIPSTEAYTTFYNDVKILHERELLATIEIEKLTELQSLLLARMGR